MEEVTAHFLKLHVVSQIITQSNIIQRPTKIMLNVVLIALAFALVPLMFIAQEYGGFLYYNVIGLQVLLCVHIVLMNW